MNTWNAMNDIFYNAFAPSISKMQIAIYGVLATWGFNLYGDLLFMVVDPDLVKMGASVVVTLLVGASTVFVTLRKLRIEAKRRAQEKAQDAQKHSLEMQKLAMSHLAEIGAFDDNPTWEEKVQRVKTYLENI